MLTTHVAVTAGLDVDRVEDAALASTEAFELLVGLEGLDTIGCTAVPGTRRLDVSLSARPPVADFPVASLRESLGGRILDGLADTLEFSPQDARITFAIAATE